MEPQNNPNKKVGISIGGAVLVVVILVTIFLGKKPAVDTSALGQTPAPISQTPPTTPVSTTPAPVTTSVSQTPPPVDTTKKSTSVYKDGTYTATGSYMSPGGQDQITITLTLANDIITDTSAVSGANDGTSNRYQNRFISGYKQYVVGKNIASVNLTRVSGSSLTSKGFSDALKQIETQAKA